MIKTEEVNKNSEAQLLIIETFSCSKIIGDNAHMDKKQNHWSFIQTLRTTMFFNGFFKQQKQKQWEIVTECLFCEICFVGNRQLRLTGLCSLASCCDLGRWCMYKVQDPDTGDLGPQTV